MSKKTGVIVPCPNCTRRLNLEIIKPQLYKPTISKHACSQCGCEWRMRSTKHNMEPKKVFTQVIVDVQGKDVSNLNPEVLKEMESDER